nr:uncharacterized protein LOC113742348 [Coffea arabica]
MFFFCSNVKAIWEAAPLSWDDLESFRSKFWLWWEELKDAVKQERMRERVELTVNLLWQIWKSRNGVQFNNKRRDPTLAVHKAVVEWREFHDIQEAEVERVGGGVTENEGISGWGRPKEGWIKVNSNTTLHLETDKAGWGIIVRNWQGKVVEQLGQCQGHYVVRELNSANEEVIRCTVIADLKKLILNFDECCFAYTRRANNFVSHSLAKKALQLECSAEWKDSFAGWLLELAHADCKDSCLSVT